MNTWQPIESAPKDGTPILLYDAKLPLEPPTVGSIWEDEAIDANGVEFFQPPTHWMPLPEPPKANP